MQTVKRKTGCFVFTYKSFHSHDAVNSVVPIQQSRALSECIKYGVQIVNICVSMSVGVLMWFL